MQIMKVSQFVQSSKYILNPFEVREPASINLKNIMSEDLFKLSQITLLITLSQSLKGKL